MSTLLTAVTTRTSRSAESWSQVWDASRMIGGIFEILEPPREVGKLCLVLNAQHYYDVDASFGTALVERLYVTVLQPNGSTRVLRFDGHLLPILLSGRTIEPVNDGRTYVLLELAPDKRLRSG